MECWVSRDEVQPLGPTPRLRASLRPPLRPWGPADWPRPNTPCLPVKHAKLQLITSNLPLITPKNQINWHLPKKWAVDFSINCTWRSRKYLVSLLLIWSHHLSFYYYLHYGLINIKIHFKYFTYYHHFKKAAINIAHISNLTFSTHTWKNTIQTDFHLFKKGEISLKNEKSPFKLIFIWSNRRNQFKLETQNLQTLHYNY